MKLIRCKDCNHFHTIKYTSCGMCHCGHVFFARKSYHEREVYVYGPCEVWMISDNELDKAEGGDIIRLKKLEDTNKLVLRKDKGFLLFIDQPDKRKDYHDASR